MKKRDSPFFRITASIVLFNAIIAAMAGVLIALDRFDDLQVNFLFSHFIYSVLGIIGTLLICFLYFKIDKNNPWILGFHIRKKDICFSLAAVFLSLLVALTFVRLLEQAAGLEADFQFERILSGNFYGFLCIAIIGLFFAALKEEVLARGYFMANLTRVSILQAILLSAFLFMGLHFIMGDFDPYKAISWFRGGIVYAYIYVKSGSLLVSTIIHTAHNVVNDFVLHGSEGALVLLSFEIATSDKLIYELVLGTLLVALTYFFYGRSGILTPARNLKQLWYPEIEKNESEKQKAN